jgi:arsenate reductase (thioredoxin)
MNPTQRSSRKKVLILCTGNSCRSQMAEAIVNHELGDTWQAFSAGTQPSSYVHPLAVRALAEIGLQHQGESKSTEIFRGVAFDVVITVCDDAAENCPVWLGSGKKVHIGFPDPAKVEGDEEARMGVFRQVRDDIRARIVPYLQRLPGDE